jgi:hypothetical protein
VSTLPTSTSTPATTSLLRAARRFAPALAIGSLAAAPLLGLLAPAAGAQAPPSAPATTVVTVAPSSPSAAAGSTIPVPAGAPSAAITPAAPAPTGATVRAADAAPSASTPGYWMTTDAGSVAAFGGTAYAGSLTQSVSRPIVAIVPTPDGGGYWLADGGGAVYAFGDAGFYGSASRIHLRGTIAGMAASPDGHGYWLVGSDGGVFAFGDAGYYGSAGSLRLRAGIVGMAATPSGHGYWLAAADGGIFAFGDAGFHGSAGLQSVRHRLVGTRLAAPIVGIAATSDGQGYWLAGADGGVFAFGDASYRGRATASRIVGITGTADRGGYWLVASNGATDAFGDAPSRGQALGTLPRGQWVTAIVWGPGSGSGAVSTGAFGPGEAVPTNPGSSPTPAPTSAFSMPNTAQVSAARYASGTTGYDISWPQCGEAYPPPAAVSVVGVNHGTPFTFNPCFGSEASWAQSNLSLYINVNSPQGSMAGEWDNGPAGVCASADATCKSYNYGYNAAVSSVASVKGSGRGATMWWLDVETSNYWSANTTANDAVIAGALRALEDQGLNVAVYSTNYQWGVIAGSYDPGVPVWYPTGTATAHPNNWCSARSFAGGPVRMVQSAAGRYDGDYSC